MLHIRFEQEVKPPFECDDSVRVLDGVARVADDDTARELVEAVQAEHDCCLAPQPVPNRQPASNAAAVVCCECRNPHAAGEAATCRRQPRLPLSTAAMTRS